MRPAAGRLAAALVLVLVVAFVAPACGKGGDDAPPSVLDGRPRRADVAGVVTEVSRHDVVIDGRTYPLSEQLESFSTYDGSLSSVFERKGQYVHAGLDDDGAVRWLAAIGLPGGKPPLVYFSSSVQRLVPDRHEVEFSGGTVLRVADGVTLPSSGEVEVRIDVASDRIVEASALSAGSGGGS